MRVPVLCLVVATAGVRGNLATCGRWRTGDDCQLFPGMSIWRSGTVDLLGIAAGSMAMNITLYDDGTCTRPVLHINATGSFTDIGAPNNCDSQAAAGPGAHAHAGGCQAVPAKPMRLLAFTFTDVFVESLDDISTHQMSYMCPVINSTVRPWTVGLRQLLPSPDFDPADCDISLLGGTSNKLRFDVPAFMVVTMHDPSMYDSSVPLSPTGDPEGKFASFGLMDGDPAAANTPEAAGDATSAHSFLVYKSVSGCDNIVDANLCGVFATHAAGPNTWGPNTPGCEIYVDPHTNRTAGSRTTVLQIADPPAVTRSRSSISGGMFPPRVFAPVLDSKGLYTRTTAYFSDTRCLVKEADVVERGSVGYIDGTQSGLFIMQKRAAHFTVTPSSTAQGWGTAANLTLSCPCCSGPTPARCAGSLWTPGLARAITGCPDHTCDRPAFNHWHHPGTALYAYAEHATTMFESGPGGAGAGTDSTGPATADAVTFGAWAGLAPATPTPLLTALPTGHLAGADTGITGARLGTAIETLRDAGDTGGVREMVGTTVGTTRRREVLDDPTGNLAGPDRSVNLAGPGPRTTATATAPRAGIPGRTDALYLTPPAPPVSPGVSPGASVTSTCALVCNNDICTGGAFAPHGCGTYRTACTRGPLNPLNPMALPPNAHNWTGAQLALQLNLDANLTMTQTPGDGSGNSNSNDGHVRGDFSYTKSLYNNTDGACSGRDQVFQMEARGTFYQLPRSDGTGLIDVAFHVNATDVLPLTTMAVDIIAAAKNGCRCGITAGDEWGVGHTAHVTDCQVGVVAMCDSTWGAYIFPGGAPGVANNYGVMHLNTQMNTLRLSELSANPITGAAMQFDGSTPVFTLASPTPRCGPAAPTPALPTPDPTTAAPSPPPSRLPSTFPTPIGPRLPPDKGPPDAAGDRLDVAATVGVSVAGGVGIGLGLMYLCRQRKPHRGGAMTIADPIFGAYEDDADDIAMLSLGDHEMRPL